MTTIWQRIEADAKKVETLVEGGLDWAKNLFEQVAIEEVQLVLPVVQSALQEVVADGAVLASPSGWLAAAESVGEKVTATLLTNGIEVAGASVATAISTGLADLWAHFQSSTVTAAPAAPAAS